MRKILIFLLGLASLAAVTGLSISPSVAKPALDCSISYSQCNQNCAGSGCFIKCQAALQQCQGNGPAISSPKSNKQGSPSTADHPGTHPPPPPLNEESSKPKMVNGQVVKNANGDTIMVTKSGREWAWNGKYNTYVSPASKPGNIISYSIPQGDPNAPYAKVDGKSIQVSSPQYPAALAAVQAKQNAAEAAQKAAAEKAQADLIKGAKAPGGVLQRGGTPIIKEDVDVPSRPGTQPVAMKPVSPKKPAPPKKPVATVNPAVSTPASVTTTRNQVTGHQGSSAYHAQ